MARRAREQKIGEAVAKYATRPVGEVFWIAFQSLSDEDQGAFLRKLLEDPEWCEEIEDALSIIQARTEPSRPFEEFEKELKREGLL